MSRHLLPFFLILLFLTGALSAPAQQFGGNPPTLKWRQLKTDSVNIIYPRGFDRTAYRVATVIERLQRYKPYRLDATLENAPIVLQPLTTNSNGYVGLGPYRSEFYLSAPMDAMELGAADWTTTLTLHEYRHIVQYNTINRGITRTVDWLLGDNARSLLSDMAVPDWFFEGDAVFGETFHSHQGRGRLPRFLNVYGILDRDGKQYNYQQLRNGSYKAYIPGHYNLGYLLVSYGYRHYGPGFWRKVIDDAARYKGIFYPFSRAIYRVAGVRFKDFREAAFKAHYSHYRNLSWITPELPGDSETNIAPERLSRTAHQEVVDYVYPYPALLNGRAGVIALKRQRKKLSHFVWLAGPEWRLNGKNNKKAHQNEKEIDLGRAPISRDGYFGYNGGKIIYTRFQTDPRWQYKEYSDLEILDIQRGRRSRITHKARLFTPDISENGKLIAASALSTDGRSAIVLLDTGGRELARWEAPEGMIYNYPKFFAPGANAAADNQGEALLFLQRDLSGHMGMVYVCLENIPAIGVKTGETPMMGAAALNGPVKQLLPISKQLLGFPVVGNGGNKLFYTRVLLNSGHAITVPDTNRYTSLMELDLKQAFAKAGKEEEVRPVQIASAVRDLYQGYGYESGQNIEESPGTRTLIASLQTADGYGVFSWQQGSRLPVTQRPGTDEISEGRSDRPCLLDTVATDGDGLRSDRWDDLKTSDIKKYADAVRKYPSLSHPFHFHSLQPAVEDPVYSFDILGQNILNTVQTKLSYSYNRVNRISAVGGNLSLGLWYVQPFVHMDYSWHHQAADSKGNYYSYKELTSQLGLQLPLHFTGGRFQRNIYLSTALSQSNLYWAAPKPASGTALEQIRYLYSRLQLSMTSPQSLQQLYPRTGLYTYTEMNTPLDGKGGRQWMNSTTLYLPGILPTHSFRWLLAYQHRDTAGAYGYSSRFPFSRGYVRPSFGTMWRLGADYDLPVCYPDFGFAGLVYILRIRANVYFDQSYGFDDLKRRSSFGSVGGTLYADINLGNQYPVTIGVRYNHLLNQYFPRKTNWEFILPIRLF